MSQIKLVNYQIARILSDRANERSIRFKRLKLLAVEQEKYNAYRQKDVSTLTDSELVEFQKIYCKKRMAYAINRSLYCVKLKFTVDIREEVKSWLNGYGYTLKPSTSSHNHHPDSEKESQASYYELNW